MQINAQKRLSLVKLPVQCFLFVLRCKLFNMRQLVGTESLCIKGWVNLFGVGVLLVVMFNWCWCFIGVDVFDNYLVIVLCRKGCISQWKKTFPGITFFTVLTMFLLNQTSANWGPNSRSILKAIIKALITKSSQSSIRSTNCKSRLLICQLKYSNNWPLFDVVFNLK